MAEPRSAFPLRLRDERLRTLLRVVAQQEHISQNELIEQAIEHEVVARGALMAQDLAAAAARLVELTDSQYESALERSDARFGAGEGQLEPLQARALHTSPAAHGAPAPRSGTDPLDRLGVLAAFDAGRR